MRSYPDDDYDFQELARLNPEPWMPELLKLNPEYPYWGPYEDYMMKPGREESEETNPFKKDSGWESRCIVDSWSAFGPWSLDTHNECVHFYFELERDSKNCETCSGDGYHSDARWVTESFYSHSSPFRNEDAVTRRIGDLLRSFGNGAPDKEPLRRASYPAPEVLNRYGAEFRAFCEEMRVHGAWADRITQDEVQALVEGGRLWGFTSEFVPGEGWKDKEPPYMPTATEVNAANRPGSRALIQHDAINRSILIRRRLERLGLPQDCPGCEGHGHIYTEPGAHVGLVLWMLHPRKGCSRGVHIKRIEQKEAPAVLAWLKQAADRNAGRFAAVVAKAGEEPIPC